MFVNELSCFRARQAIDKTDSVLGDDRQYMQLTAGVATAALQAFDGAQNAGQMSRDMISRRLVLRTFTLQMSFDRRHDRHPSLFVLV